MRRIISFFGGLMVDVEFATAAPVVVASCITAGAALSAACVGAYVALRARSYDDLLKDIRNAIAGGVRSGLDDLKDDLRREFDRVADEIRRTTDHKDR